MSDGLADAVEAPPVNTDSAVLSAECLAGARELCPGFVEEGHRKPPLAVVPSACTEARHHQAAGQ